MSTNFSTGEYFKGYLGKPAGVTDDRFEAFELPSIVNGKRVLPTHKHIHAVSGPRSVAKKGDTDSGSIKD